ncbi:MATE family efflux transporter [uncultured Gemmiger sp.]|uniref:MATE family efflux transporter n=1 Tax=uncultured Gemmiger sp. TaxID=1623490 RepID=UPI0025CE104D|nr:MATE family efflux transporter [uncultured Gemmiger sp.]
MSKTLSAARMGTEPLNPLLLSLAIPMMISMLVQALYNVVDSIFVSYVNEAALSAVSLAFPIQNLLIAFAVGTAVGVNAYLSKNLGEGNHAEADRAAANGLFLAVCSAVAFLIFGLFGAGAFIRAQTTDPLIARYGAEYLSICTIFSLGCCVQCMMEKILVSTGRSTFAMTTQLIGALTNIVLDPIFIFGLFGVPRLEAAGAAVATVIGQFVGATAALTLHFLYNKDVHISLRGFRPAPRTILRIYQVGIPSIAMNAIGSVMTFGMNAILIAYSSTAVAVFGVYFKLQSFVFMPVFGLNNGMVPIVSYNYGARKPERILGTKRLAAIYAVGIMVLGFLAGQFLPGVMLSIFNASPDMLSLGTVALRIISISFLMAGFNVISSAYFQALGHGVLALWVSVIRQLVVLLPTAWLLSLAGRVDVVWWAFPIAEVVAFLLCIIFQRVCYNKIIRPMRTAAAAA